MKRWILGLAAVVVLGSASVDHAGEREKIVKGSAAASKIDADGKQTVTITLEIKKGFCIYANPVDFTVRGKPDPSGEGYEVVVGIKGKESVKAEIRYPAAQLCSDGFGYKYYEGTVVVEAFVQRAAGDTSPLEVAVGYSPFERVRCICWLPERIRLTAK